MLLPIVFALVCSVVLYMAIGPLLAPLASGASMLFASPGEEPRPPQNLLQLAREAQEQAQQDAAQQARIPLSSIELPQRGDQYGQLTIEGTAIDAPVLWDDLAPELNAGIGTYRGAWLPGFGRTILLAGHNHTWLADMKSVELGAIITIETHYETYTYEVIDMVVKHHEDSSAYDFSRTDENLILYTCYPFNALKFTQERYFVYARPVSGRPVDVTS